MNPEVPVRDIMRRTMFNLNLIQQQAAENGPYEVTQLINSFLGALAHPWERFKQQLNSIDLAVAETQAWPRVAKEFQDDREPTSLGDLLRLMRNGIAHGNIKFFSDSRNVITTIGLWNIDPGTGRRTWGTELSIDVLKQLLHRFVALAEDLESEHFAVEVRPSASLDELLTKLKTKERRGSKARCHLLTHGDRNTVARRLSELVAPWGVVTPTDRWLPDGFDELAEARLGEAAELLDSEKRAQLRSWWLAVERSANTPNWDIASTFTTNGKRGLLLVEAKAHDVELRTEEKGKSGPDANSAGSCANHQRIGEAIALANQSLGQSTGCEWRLSRDSRYQMSNRFAWAWKVAELGMPVVLVYLGMLRADEMRDLGKPFATADDWSQSVRSHGHGLLPADAWNREWNVAGQLFVPVIRSVYQPLATSTGEADA